MEKGQNMILKVPFIYSTSNSIPEKLKENTEKKQNFNYIELEGEILNGDINGKVKEFYFN